MREFKAEKVELARLGKLGTLTWLDLTFPSVPWELRLQMTSLPVDHIQGRKSH